MLARFSLLALLLIAGSAASDPVQANDIAEQVNCEAALPAVTGDAHALRLSSNPDIFITKRALNYAYRVLKAGGTDGKKYIISIDWAEKSGVLYREFSEKIMALRPHVSKQEFMVAMKKEFEAHGRPLPPHIMLGGIEPWKVPKSGIVKVAGKKLWVQKDSFSDALKLGKCDRYLAKGNAYSGPPINAR